MLRMHRSLAPLAIPSTAPIQLPRTANAASATPRGPAAIRWGAPMLLASAALFAPSLAAAATDEERAGARAAATSGVEACNASKWKECIDRFERAESLVHSQVHLMYIARAHLQMGHLVEAREALLKITREGVPAGATPTIQKTVSDAERELEALEPRVPQTTIQVSGGAGDKVTVFMDGREVPAALVGISRPVNPGKHEFSASSPGMISAPVSLDIAEGEKKDVNLVLEKDPNAPEPAPTVTTADGGTSSSGFKMNGLTIGGLVAGGVGVGGAVVGTIFLLDSKSNADRVKELCGPNPQECAVDENSEQGEAVKSANDAAGSSQVIGFIGLGVGAAGLITGAVLVYLGQQEKEAPPAASGQLHVKPYFGFQSVGLTGTF